MAFTVGPIRAPTRGGVGAAAFVLTLALTGCVQTPAPEPSSPAPVATDTPAANAPTTPTDGVPVVPGYATGTFPDVPAIQTPDVSLLSGWGPEFADDLAGAVADLQGVSVAGAQCDADE